MSRLRWAAGNVAVMAFVAVVTVGVGARNGAREVAPGAGERGPERGDVHAAAVDRALDQGDLARASRLWRDAYGAALRSQRWEPMLTVGDAAARISRAARPVSGFDAEARQCYLGALFRARDQQSIDGVLRVAEALARLGDVEVARGAVRMADRLVQQRGEAGPAIEEP